MSPGAALRFLALAIAATLLREVEIDPAARRVQHAHALPDADGAPRLGALQDRPLLVELPPVPAQAADGEQAVVPRPEGDERAGADDAGDLAFELLLPAVLVE